MPLLNTLETTRDKRSTAILFSSTTQSSNTFYVGYAFSPAMNTDYAHIRCLVSVNFQQPLMDVTRCNFFRTEEFNYISHYRAQFHVRRHFASAISNKSNLKVGYSQPLSMTS